MKIKKLFILLTFIFVLGFSNVKANTIYGIDVDVYVDENANANITFNIFEYASEFCSIPCNNSIDELLKNVFINICIITIKKIV